MVIQTIINYYKSINFYLNNENYKECPYLKKEHHKVNLYSISLISKLWNTKHYRNNTLKNDLIKNLRNVIIPGTFIPISFFCYHKLFYYFFIYLFYPLICITSFLIYRDNTFEEYLYCPDTWFTYWRINCILSLLHYSKTKNQQYLMEDKYLFLKKAKENGISVTPFIEKDVIIKDRNEEGGMGIQYIKNAVNGGKMVIQEKINNSNILSKLLPENAALSTFRVVTTRSLSGNISVLTIVWRAARNNTTTDHNNIAFNVNNDGSFGLGISNQNWYMRNKFFKKTFEKHPDSGKQITNINIGSKFISEIERLCLNAHNSLLNKIPLVGWDVAITEKGIMILECNLSCNFFCGEFNKHYYFNFIKEYFEFFMKKNI